MLSLTLASAPQVLLVSDPLKMIGIHTRPVVAKVISLQSLRDWSPNSIIGVCVCKDCAPPRDAETAITLLAEGSDPKMAPARINNHLCVESLICWSRDGAMPKIRLERALRPDPFFGFFRVLPTGKRCGRLVAQYVPLSRIGKLAAAALARIRGSTRSRLSSGASIGQMVTGDEPRLRIARIDGLAAPTLTESNVRRPTKTLAHCLQLMPRDVPHGVALDPSSAAARLGSEGGRLFASALAVHGGIIP